MECMSITNHVSSLDAEAALLRAGGRSAVTWQVARQQESATVGVELVGSKGEFCCTCMPDNRASQVNSPVFPRYEPSALGMSQAIGLEVEASLTVKSAVRVTVLLVRRSRT